MVAVKESVDGDIDSSPLIFVPDKLVNVYCCNFAVKVPICMYVCMYIIIIIMYS